MKATLKQYRQAPRKMRLLADMIRGKRADVALTELAHSPKRGARTFEKLLKSALANAKQGDEHTAPEQFYIDRVTVDEGFTIKRFMPRAFGRATPINKRTSHITVVLKEQQNSQEASGTQQTNAKSHTGASKN